MAYKKNNNVINISRVKTQDMNVTREDGPINSSKHK